MTAQDTRIRDAGAAKSQFDNLKDDISKLTDTVKSLASEELSAAAGNAQHTAEKTLGDLERSIRRNPTQATLIAGGVGLLVGLILSR